MLSRGAAMGEHDSLGEKYGYPQSGSRKLRGPTGNSTAGERPRGLKPAARLKESERC